MKIFREKYSREYYYHYLHTLLDISCLLMNAVCFTGIYMVLDIYASGDMHPGYGIVCTLIMYAVCLFFRHAAYIKLRWKIPVVIFGHILIFIFILLRAYVARDIKPERTAYLLILAVCLFIGSIKHSLSGFAHLFYVTKWWLAIEAFLIYLFGIFQKLSGAAVTQNTVDCYEKTGLVLIVFFVILHFWCLYLSGLNDYMDQNADIENIPGASIISLGSKQILTLILFTLLFILIMFFFKYDHIFSSMSSYVGRFIAGILKWFQHLFDLIRGINNPAKTSGNMPDITFTPKPATEYVENKSNEIVMRVLMILSIPVMLVLIRGLFFVFEKEKRPPWRRPDYKNVRVSGDTIEDIYEEERQGFHLFKTNREKIRAMYKKYVQKNKKAYIYKGCTPGEIKDKVEHPYADDVTKIYERTRYSKESVPDNDVRLMKKFTKRHAK